MNPTDVINALEKHATAALNATPWTVDDNPDQHNGWTSACNEFVRLAWTLRTCLGEPQESSNAIKKPIA